jgi:hypothetical protein
MKASNKELLLKAFEENPQAAGCTWEAYEGKKNNGKKRFKTNIGSVDIKIIYNLSEDEWTYKSKILDIQETYMEKGISPQQAAEYAVLECKAKLFYLIEKLMAANNAFFQKGY